MWQHFSWVATQYREAVRAKRLLSQFIRAIVQEDVLTLKKGEMNAKTHQKTLKKGTQKTNEKIHRKEVDEKYISPLRGKNKLEANNVPKSERKNGLQ